jgi:hypothetical protein
MRRPFTEVGVAVNQARECKRSRQRPERNVAGKREDEVIAMNGEVSWGEGRGTGDS